MRFMLAILNNRTLVRKPKAPTSVVRVSTPLCNRIGKADELPVHNRKGVGNQTNRGRVHLVIRLLAKVTTKFGPPLPPSPPSPKGGKGGKITLLLYNIVVIFWF